MSSSTEPANHLQFKQCQNCLTSKAEAALYKCGRCKTVAYCSKECQIQHWHAQHKQYCKGLAEGLQRRSDKGLTELHDDLLNWSRKNAMMISCIAAAGLHLSQPQAKDKTHQVLLHLNQLSHGKHKFAATKVEIKSKEEMATLVTQHATHSAYEKSGAEAIKAGSGITYELVTTNLFLWCGEIMACCPLGLPVEEEPIVYPMQVLIDMLNSDQM